MKPKAKAPIYKRIALILSLCALVAWGIMGTGASLAWFTDTTPQLVNIFHKADFDLEVSHRLTDGTWEPVDSQTKIFDENALYEPGYVQIVYLRVKNTGEMRFDVDTAVNVNGCTVAVNMFGQEFLLQNYLKFGVAISSNEEDMKNAAANRQVAAEIATEPLHHYYSIDTAELLPNETKYITLIVRMPEEVDNVANYRGSTVPRVDLGVTIKVTQITN